MRGIFLILQNLAAPATEANLKKSTAEQQSKKVQRERAHEEFHNLKAAIAERGIVIKKKTYKNGKLYAAVSAKDILDGLKTLGFPLPVNLNEDMVKFDTPIKTTGKHEAKIVLGTEEITLQILCEASS